MMTTKPLRTDFMKNGLHLVLICRRKGKLLLKTLDFKGRVLGYEVHKIRVQKVPLAWSDSPSWKGYDSFETYASNEEFGCYAWSYQYFDAVVKDFPQFKGALDNNPDNNTKFI